MKRLLKARKDFAGIRFVINKGDLVYGIPEGDSYSVSPVGRDDLTMSGVPAHYLVETSHRG